MDVHKFAARQAPVTGTPRRCCISISSLTVRVMIALVISWLIIMAFFVTGAISH
jgi:hypothetical protein